MLKLQCFGHLMWRVNSLEKTLMLGKLEGRSRRGQQRMRQLDGITESKDMSFEQTSGNSEGQGSLALFSSWGRKESDTTVWLNWTIIAHGFLMAPVAKWHRHSWTRQRLNNNSLAHWKDTYNLYFWIIWICVFGEAGKNFTSAHKKSTEIL